MSPSLLAQHAGASSNGRSFAIPGSSPKRVFFFETPTSIMTPKGVRIPFSSVNRAFSQYAVLLFATFKHTVAQSWTRAGLFESGSGSGRDFQNIWRFFRADI